MIEGELLAVRAYLHFDLMRLFGCSNLAGRSDLESRHTIPYSTAVEKDAAPQLTYAETIRNLVTDLTEAAPPAGGRPGPDRKPGRPLRRSQHRRVLRLPGTAPELLRRRGAAGPRLHVGRLPGEQSVWRCRQPWRWDHSRDPTGYKIYNSDLTLRTFTDATKAPTTEMCFPSEHLFALDVNDLNTMISGQSQPRIHLRRPPVPHAVHQEFDRRRSLRDQGRGHHRLPLQDALPQHRILARGDQDAFEALPADLDEHRLRIQEPSALIRLPEMYYIAAECYVTGPEKDLGEARRLLDEVRKARAIYESLDENLDEVAMKSEIEKEYRKEFSLRRRRFLFLQAAGLR
ncbi:MAG: hypothetical protein V8Q54_06135 [Alistipes senegalensis]